MRISDIQGKTYRIGAGFSMEILKRLGANAMWCSGEEVYSSLDRGVIDIATWGTPSENWGMKLHEVCPYLYWPGWRKQSDAHAMEINLDNWNALPDHLRAMLTAAIHEDARSFYKVVAAQADYFQKLVDYGVEMHKLPPEDLELMKRVAEEVMSEEADRNPLFKEVWENQKAFLVKMVPYLSMAEL